MRVDARVATPRRQNPVLAYPDSRPRYRHVICLVGHVLWLGLADCQIVEAAILANLRI
jgi:hypothetical protein